ISRESAVRAYEELIAQEFAESKSTQGTFVRQAKPAARVGYDRRAKTSKLEGSISNYGNRVTSNERTHATAGHLDALNVGATPAKPLPIRSWRELMLKHCKFSTRAAYKPSIFGRLELRKVLAEYVRRTKGIDCGVDRIVVFSQSVSALSILCRALLDG